MNTPIVDFLKEYEARQESRFHMPGHKGKAFLGCEPWDITEVAGADVLGEARGIIGKSQAEAARLFGAGETFYSTEGSSQCIKGMLGAALLRWRQSHAGRGMILAARNVHRAMVDGCALLDLDLEFLPGRGDSLCRVAVTARDVETALEDLSQKQDREMPVAVYITTPDYLGGMLDVRAIATVCHAYGTLLLVDHAHGAYLAFLEGDRHPMRAGADMCCDSAHKTLPVLTGGAYLHVAKRHVGGLSRHVRRMMTLFGSTSPSYLIMASLDMANGLLQDGYIEKMRRFTAQVDGWKNKLTERGIALADAEPWKIVIDAAQHGYTGEETAQEMRGFGMECEFADRRFVVLMLTPENGEQDGQRLLGWAAHSMLTHAPGEPPEIRPYRMRMAQRVMTLREATLAPSERIPVREAEGRVLAEETVSCPPAIPVGISGERIDREMIRDFTEYGIDEVSVVSGLVKE